MIFSMLALIRGVGRQGKGKREVYFLQQPSSEYARIFAACSGLAGLQRQILFSYKRGRPAQSGDLRG
jgi:hypothetical protein